jgi:single-strand DNA-binding protein
MQNINQIVLAGRLGRDPEVRSFESGSTVAKLSIAVNRARNEDPDWFDVECWGKLAEIAGKYSLKGSLVGIVGELQLDEWTDKKTGKARFKPVILAYSIDLLSARGDISEGSGVIGDNTDFPVF